MGNCACGDLNRGSVQRGLRYLITTQQADGSWTEPQITGTGFPKVFYLRYDMYRQNFPLLALATYVNYRNGIGHAPSFFRCTAALNGRGN
jgi:squalene-hopene/tetraprenyl-beta-curcumene cyclase